MNHRRVIAVNMSLSHDTGEIAELPIENGFVGFDVDGAEF